MNNFVYLGSILKIRSILVFLISIVLANDPPIIDPIENQFMDEDSEITLTVIANDIDGDELSYEASSSDENVSSVFNNNELTLIPSLDWNGTVDITVTVSDSEESVVETFELLVNPVNDTPVLTSIPSQEMDEDSELILTLIANDVENDNIDFSATINNDNILIEVDSNILSVIPGEDYNGIANITISVWDDVSPEIITSEIFEVLVLQVNDHPEISNIFFANIDSLYEDDVNIEYIVEYTDIDSDISLNLNPIDLNTSNWFIRSIDERIFSSYYIESNTFLIDSLQSNWNGMDSLEIIITDLDGLSDTMIFDIFAHQVVDKPKILEPYFLDNSSEIAEDTTNTEFIIPYINIDANPDLNLVPLNIQSISIDEHDIFENINNINESLDYDSLYQNWSIESLIQNWNGRDSLLIFIESINGDLDSLFFPIRVYQVIDMPLLFDIENSIEQYGIDSSSYYLENDGANLFYRYPFTLEVPENEQNYFDFLLHWDRTSDIDTDSTLNNDILLDLFYRIELFSNDDDMVYILADSIPDLIFDEDSLCYMVVQPDSICSKY